MARGRRGGAAGAVGAAGATVETAHVLSLLRPETVGTALVLSLRHMRAIFPTFAP
jgi:hypothetical protein